MPSVKWRGITSHNNISFLYPIIYNYILNQFVSNIDYKLNISNNIGANDSCANERAICYLNFCKICNKNRINAISQ